MSGRYRTTSGQGLRPVWLLSVGAVLVFVGWVWAELLTGKRDDVSFDSEDRSIGWIPDVSSSTSCPVCDAPFTAQDVEFWSHVQWCVVIELGLSGDEVRRPDVIRGGGQFVRSGSRFATAAEAMQYDALQQEMRETRIERWRRERLAWYQNGQIGPMPEPPWLSGWG